MDIELLKFTRVLKSIQQYRGNGTSFITLLIPPLTKISDVSKMITEELSSASNVKSRINRQSVTSCLTSCQQKLKLYKEIPKNGLMVLSGEDEKKCKKITLSIEPPRPIPNFLYKCDNKFHIDNLFTLLKDSDKYGFIIITGDDYLFALLQGENKEILYKETDVNLPKKHNKGGQSSVRFSRLREEARTNYLSKVTEKVTKFFISENMPNVKGLILAGFADFKNLLSERLDPRLKKIILNIVDISYGGEQGLNQAIEISKDILKDVKLISEKKIVSEFMNEIVKPSKNGEVGYCFGVNETMRMLEDGMIKKLIVWDNLPYCRVVENIDDEKKVIKYVLDAKNESKEGNLLEYLMEDQKTYDELFIVSDKTSEGSQFCKGFQIGGILRYPVAQYIEHDESNVNVPEDDGDFI